MHAPPFHRRILPWIFAIVFLAVAPALIFYTSGYRFDTTKGQVERNGTVIFDSIPSGAEVWIDGRDLNQKTPYTAEQVPPGTHQFELVKTGYVPWHKSLDVYPELVTFVNDVHLWPIPLQTDLGAATAFSLFSDPAHDRALLISTSTVRVVREVGSGLPVEDAATIQSPVDVSPASIPLFSADGNDVLAGNIAFRLSGGDIQEPPSAVTRFENHLLTGASDMSLLTFDTSNGQLTRVPLPTSTVDELDGNQIRVGPAGQLVFVAASDLTHGYELPEGNWRFDLSGRGYLLLRDGTSWLSIVMSNGTATDHQASGDALRSRPNQKTDEYLLVNGTELWDWDPLQDPALLTRESQPIVAADWMPTTNDVVYATAKQVEALDLDARAGRITTLLGQFDRVLGLATLGNEVLVLADKNGSPHLFGLPTK